MKCVSDGLMALVAEMKYNRDAELMMRRTSEYEIHGYEV